ncbi:putative phosphorylase superfamily protein [Colletotrichum scovillei]|uniref:putative phosphorylase superfamily protein n=1 Tax=Colletotrichum scovillei TaxID=1209932 RepID=UPI0015C36DF5|nr:putative phosphorylase superfamily protein [Colletotrichum scovillei]KAF4772710.1 putative phosphorylase superfamily protein [Colletotrichum scovillei]
MPTHSNSGVSIQYLYDHARELVADLARKRGLTKSRERPIIFVVHSLGGIVVKSALIHSDTAREGALAEHRSIKTSTHGILFMGTPHQGGNGVQLGRVLVNVASIFVSANDRLLRHLERDSEWLQQQLGQYGPISRDFVTKFAYEVFETPTPLGRIMVVPRASAVVPGQTDGEPIAIHADHINMVKFAFKEDSNYVKVLEVLQIMVADACSNIQSRWETEERVTRARIGHKILEKKCTYLVWPILLHSVSRQQRLCWRRKRPSLHSMLFHDHCQSVALCGLGGIGKLVALKLAYLIKEGRPEYSIFWVPASSKETFNEAYLAVAKKLGVHATDNEDLRLALMHHLRSSASGKWLLIIDNADDEDVLYGSQDGSDGVLDYLPQSEAGVTLFTTRFSRIATSVATENVIDLANMSFDEAHSFMRHSLVKGLYEEGNVLNELLEDLTYLPLAIAQSAAYMNENRTSMREYLDLLRNTEQDMIELLSSKFHDRTRYRNKDSQHPVATTWFLSFSKIHKDHPQAASLLMFLSCIEPKGIPRSILPKLPSEQQLTAAIGTLCAYAFLTQRGNAKVYDMHRLVHLAASVWIDNQPKEKNFAVEIRENAVRQVTGVFPSEVFENLVLQKEYMPHALHLLNGKDLDAVGMWELSCLIAPILTIDGRYKEAIKVLEQLEAQQMALDEEHPDRLALKVALAMVYFADGRVKDSIAALEPVVEVYGTTLDGGHPDQLASRRRLAEAYHADGRVKDAIGLLEYIVEVEEATLDKDNSAPTSSQYLLAMVYETDGRFKDAIKLLEHVVEMQRTTLNEGHLNRLTAQHGLAVAYQADGRIKDAIELLEHIIELHKTMLDEGHPNRLASQGALASAYRGDGRVKDAIDLLENVVEVRKTTLDEGHPGDLQQKANLQMKGTLGDLQQKANLQRFIE